MRFQSLMHAEVKLRGGKRKGCGIFTSQHIKRVQEGFVLTWARLTDEMKMLCERLDLDLRLHLSLKEYNVGGKARR